MQTYTREEQCRLWLQSAPSLSWRTREALLTYFGCAESIFEQMGPTVQMMAGDKAYAELQQMKTAGRISGPPWRNQRSAARAVYPRHACGGSL